MTTPTLPGYNAGDPELSDKSSTLSTLPGYNAPDPELTDKPSTLLDDATPPPTSGTGAVAFGIPEADKAEYWKVGDTYYIIYMVPDSDPPIPMAWETTLEELQTIVGPGRNVTITKEVSQEEANSQGMTVWGKATELSNLSDHPFDAYVALISDQAAVRPWLRDAGVLALIAQATLEGRPVTEAEFQQTEWYSSKNDRERKWLLTYESDPKTAQTLLDDARFQAEEDLMQAGINSASPELIEYMSLQVTTGVWTREYYNRQVKAISDPDLGYDINQDMLDEFGGSIEVGTNQQYEDTIRNLAQKWLGPAMGQMTDADVARWASRFRSTPDGPAELEDELRRQRLALFPEYEDPTLTYEDIAMPWRSKWQQVWGETPDETDPLFNQIIRANDATEAGKLLTREGLKRGIVKVEQDTQIAVDRSFRANAGVVSLR